MPRVYSVQAVGVTLTQLTTLVQIKPGISSIQVLRCKLTQSGSTTSAMQEVKLVTTTGAATVGSQNPQPMDPDGAAAKAVGGTSATGVGANNNGVGSGASILFQDAFNLLTGWERIFTPEERPEVGGGGGTFLGLVVLAPTGSTVFDAVVVFQEIG